MSKSCTTCGNLCQDTDLVCPVCGSPLTIPTANQPVHSEPAPQSNLVPVQPQTVPTYTQPTQAQTASNHMQQPQPPKKKHTLAIVLGIIGGILVLLILGLLILLVVLPAIVVQNHLSSHSISSNGTTTTITSHADPHDYYYPDYDASDLNSEAYADPSTEAPAVSTAESDTSTESGSDPAASDDVSRFSSDDLTLYLIHSATGETINSLPVTNTFNNYTIRSDGKLQETNEAIDGSVDYRAETGRHIGIGTSYDALLSTYGIDSTNAIWSKPSAAADSYDYYYFSTITQPDDPEQHTLILGWGNTENGWMRLYTGDLADSSDGILPSDVSSVVLYRFSFDASLQVTGIQITYLE